MERNRRHGICAAVFIASWSGTIAAARGRDAHGEAREFVTAQKQQRVIAAAQHWLSLHETALQPRFDVIEVYAPQGENGPVRINHIENAFM